MRRSEEGTNTKTYMRIMRSLRLCGVQRFLLLPFTSIRSHSPFHIFQKYLSSWINANANSCLPSYSEQTLLLYEFDIYFSSTECMELPRNVCEANGCGFKETEMKEKKHSEYIDNGRNGMKNSNAWMNAVEADWLKAMRYVALIQFFFFLLRICLQRCKL